MKDYGISVLEQYEMEVYSTRRTRGAVLCDTNQGLFLLKEAHADAGRMPVLAGIYKLLNENGFVLIDTPIQNKEGEYITTAEDGVRYMLKRWFIGRECEVRRESDLLEGARHLARIHKVMKVHGGQMTEADVIEGTLEEEYGRHNRELRKVRTFIRKRSVKGQFETEFLKSFEEMYGWAQGVTDRVSESGIRTLYQQAIAQGTIVHGDYNYHNLLFTQQGLSVTGFERAHQDLQLEDFYYFLRKTLEKHRYDERLGYRMLRAYDSESSLGALQREYLALRLAYPEKFWKTANLYYHSNKAWIPAKNVEKLQTSIMQNEEKKRFLSNIFGFHL